MDSPVQMCGLFTNYFPKPSNSKPSKPPNNKDKKKTKIDKGNLEQLNDIFGVN